MNQKEPSFIPSTYKGTKRRQKLSPEKLEDQFEGRVLFSAHVPKVKKILTRGVPPIIIEKAKKIETKVPPREN